MAINFPSSPTDGQIFINGNAVYGYSAALGVWNAWSLGTAEPYNYLINPQFDVSQENSDAEGVTGTLYYPADQWKTPVTVSGGAGSKRVAAATPNNSQSKVRMRCIIAKGALAAADYWLLQQSIEGYRCIPWRFGNAAARQLILRFWFKTNATNTFAISLRNGVLDRTYVKTFLATAGEFEYSFVIPGDTMGTWPLTNALGAVLTITLACGTTYQGTDGVWQAGNFLSAAGAYNGLASTANTYDISDVGLYMDSAKTGRAPPWEPVPTLQAQLDSLRYWHATAGGRGVVSAVTSASRVGIAHPVEMRAAPALTMDGPVLAYDGTANNAATMGTTYPNTRFAEFQLAGTGLTIGRAVMQNTAGGGQIVASARI